MNVAIVSIVKRNNICSLLFVVTVLLMFTIQHNALCCDNSYGDPIRQFAAACWAADLDYLCGCYYFSYYTLNDFNIFACVQGYPTPVENCYFNCIGSDCYALEFAACKCGLEPGIIDVLMAAAGFVHSFHSTRPTPTDINNFICSSMDKYILAVFDAEGDVLAHIVAMTGYTLDPNNDINSIIKYMDSNDDNYQYSPYYEFTLGPGYYGQWIYYYKVEGFYPSQLFDSITEISDIQYFAATKEGVQTRLEFQIADMPPTTEQYGVYIADNSLGPARLIDDLVGTPVLDPYLCTNTVYHNPLAGSLYYYFLDYSSNLSAIKPTLESAAYPAIGNPINFGSDRVHYSPPTNIRVSDVSNDKGEALLVEWDLSQDYLNIDCYNIYRKETYEGYEGEYIYITSIPADVDEYLDESLKYYKSYKYLISSAHHGDFSGTLDDEYGIFNDFSVSSDPYQPINNYFSYELSTSLIGTDSILVCPQGDANELDLVLTIMGSDNNPSPGIPADNIILFLSYNDQLMNYCDVINQIPAQNDTDDNGQVAFQYSNIGGCDTLIVYAQVLNEISNFHYINIRSADITGDGMVSLADLSLFLPSYNKGPSDPGYCPCCDFTWDDYCSLEDFSFFAEHYQHTCPQGAQQAASSIYNESEYAVNIIIDVNDNDNSAYARVVLENIYDITIIGIVLNNNIQGYNFFEWIPSTDLQITSIALPVINNYREIIYLAVYSEIAMAGDYLELGTLVYQCENNEALLTTQNTSIFDGISIISAEAINKDNEIISLQGTTIFENDENEVPNINYLTNNYPNPFNPSTTIEYGISKDSWVSINIYDISGRLIKVLINEMQKAGNHRTYWDGKDHKGKDAASGIYFCKLNTGKYECSIKLALLR